MKLYIPWTIINVLHCVNVIRIASEIIAIFLIISEHYRDWSVSFLSDYIIDFSSVSSLQVYNNSALTGYRGLKFVSTHVLFRSVLGQFAWILGTNQG